MERRSFLLSLGAPALVPVFEPVLSGARAAGLRTYRPRLGQLIAANDERIPELLNRQVKGGSGRLSGGILDASGIPSPNGAAGWIRALACAWATPASKYHRSPKLLDAMVKAMEFLLREQHEDGTIDLYTTNFHSTPDTAFAVEPLAMACALLSEAPDLQSSMKSFLLRAGEALSSGGIHTPNHRWVVCMALSRLNTLFPDTKYTDRIDLWLREKIDIDPDGQFTEKSASIYSPLTDRCLITMARLLERPELFEPVRRNLEMTLYYVHPDGSIVTEASERQDQYRRGSMAAYFYPYAYMALLDGNGQFAAVAERIWQQNEHRPSEWLGFFLEDVFLTSRPVPEPEALPSDYTKIFPSSNLVRIRHGDMDATVLAKNPVFFTFENGDAVLIGLRFASAFFGKGQFRGESVENAEGSFILKQALEGPYYQPMAEKHLREDGDWNRMDKSLREKSEVQVLESTVKIGDMGTGFEITIEIGGTDNVPVAVELGFPNEGRLAGVRRASVAENSYILEDGFGEYSFRGHGIRFGPGLGKHQWTALRGALPKLPGRSVYLTGFTPFLRTLKISGEPAP